jgi:hypothetical protein
VNSNKRKCIFAFQWQQYLRERTKMFPYMCSTCISSFVKVLSTVSCRGGHSAAGKQRANKGTHFSLKLQYYGCMKRKKKANKKGEHFFTLWTHGCYRSCILKYGSRISCSWPPLTCCDIGKNNVLMMHEHPVAFICSPIPVAARSKAWVCGRSLAGIAGSNLAVGMEVCLLWVLSVVM